MLNCAQSFNGHVINVKAKATAGTIRKLANSKWGTYLRTLQTTALALCYSAAEYACPVWGHSPHAKNLHSVLSAACRAIAGWLKPTNVDDPNLLAGIASPAIRR